MTILESYTNEQLTKIAEQSTSLNNFLINLGYTSSGGSTLYMARKKLRQLGIDYQSIFHIRRVTPRNESNVFVKDSTASQNCLRRMYKKGNYTPYKCSICGQGPVWNGKPMTLILDHINGCKTDDVLSNLRWVCPNCNQQLETTGFKKMRVDPLKSKKQHHYCSKCGKEIAEDGLCTVCFHKTLRKVVRPDREELKQMIRTTPFSELGERFGVCDNTIRKWCKAEKLPFRTKDIETYSDSEWEKV